MNMPLLLSIVAAGFAVAFFHAAIPTHWLPFVLTARVQGWSKTRTLGVTAIAGSGHVLFTTLLGVLIVWAGMAVDHWTGSVFPWIAGGVLVAFGTFFLIRQAMGAGHGHVHLIGGHAHEPPHEHDDHHGHDHAHHDHRVSLVTEPRDFSVSRNRVSDRAAILSLFTLLTFSPCEGFLPVYVSVARFGWLGFAVGSLTLALATLAGMMTFTSLTMAGIERLNLKFLEHYESAILGVVLCVLGVLIVLVES
jgi:nickel/cobalt exporter